MLKNGIDKRIKDAAKRVALKAGVPAPEKWATMYCDCGDKECPGSTTVNVGVGLEDGKVQIVATAGTADRVLPAHLEAVLAHELGHVANGDIYNAHLQFQAVVDPEGYKERQHAQEYAADAFAKKLGYGDLLADALDLHRAEVEEDGDGESITHPAINTRIARLRAS